MREGCRVNRIEYPLLLGRIVQLWSPLLYPSATGGSRQSLHPATMSGLPITADERTPLVNGNGNTAHQPLSRRVMNVLKAEGQPSWLSSYKWFLFGSWFNILLVFVPLSAIAHYSNWDAALRFGFSFAAIMPLAAVRLP